MGLAPDWQKMWRLTGSVLVEVLLAGYIVPCSMTFEKMRSHVKKSEKSVWSPAHTDNNPLLSPGKSQSRTSLICFFEGLTSATQRPASWKYNSLETCMVRTKPSTHELLGQTISKL